MSWELAARREALVTHMVVKQPRGLAPRSPGLPAACWALPGTSQGWGKDCLDQHLLNRLGLSSLLL